MKKSRTKKIVSILLMICIISSLGTSLGMVTFAATNGLPGLPNLSHNNWNEDGNYTITMDMWWGNNGTSWKLYENGQLIYTQALSDLSPNAQRATYEVTGKSKGVYTYTCDLINTYGVNKSSAITVNVTTGSTPPSGVNYDFENGISGWTTDAFLNTSNFTYETSGGINNSRCLSITSNTANDAWWTTTANLEPREVYVIKGMVKGANIVNTEQLKVGANIGVGNTFSSQYNPSEGGMGSFDWTEFKLSFEASETGVTPIYLRLGHRGNVNQGKVWFDNVSITKDTSYGRNESTHLVMKLKTADTANITPENMNRWLGHLDAAYDAYAELVGTTPFNGQKIDVFSTDIYPGGWAVAGNPILWHSPYVAGTLTTINNTDEWCFGILHEIGHDFNMESSKWNWDDEMFTNFRMYYAIDKLGGKVYQTAVDSTGNETNKLYNGATELKEFYKTDSKYSWEKHLKNGEYMADGLMYKLIQIRDIVGWEPFKLTFKDLMASNATYSSNWEKFNTFMNKLKSYSNFDVYSVFNNVELTAVQNGI